MFGLMAKDVEKVDPDLVVRDDKTARLRPYSVRYDQVNAMLLNEFLKEHRKVEELKSDNYAAEIYGRKAGSSKGPTATAKGRVPEIAEGERTT